MKKTNGLRTWIEIHTAHIAHNVGVFKNHIGPNTKLMGVVKSNAYGHDFIEFSKQLEKLNVDWLGVDSIVEATRLRTEGITLSILVLGHTLPERVEEAVDNTITLTVSSMDVLKLWAESSKKISVHIKVDTGLHRQGFGKEEIHEVVEFLSTHKEQFDVTGLFTHFAQAKDPNNRTYTNQQIAEFKEWIDAFKNAGFNPLAHACASAGTLIYPEAYFDMVRVGAGLYGLWPSPEVKQALEAKLILKPVLEWKTLVVEIKKVPKGSGISYDLTETVQRDSVIAICPIGYWHGFPRKLSSIGNVLINGIQTKVLGRIAMDMIVIDVTDIPHLELYEEVVLIGKSGDKEITARQIAEQLDTTSYEIVTRLNSRIKKMYINSDI